MATTEIIALDAKAYYSTTALDGTNVNSVSWVEMTNISDATLSLTKEVADGTTRGNNGTRKNVGTILDVEISFTIDADTSVAWWTAIKDAYTGNTTVPLFFGDADETSAGSDGPAGNFIISSFTRGEPIGGVLTYEVTALIHDFFEWHTSQA